jgi:hypothetical protein
MNITSTDINTAGLIFDIIGAWLVAKEVTSQFRGQQYEIDPTWDGADKPPWNSTEFKKWELKKYRFMWAGLICLTFGFTLQITSNYIPKTKMALYHEIPKNIQTYPDTKATTATNIPPKKQDINKN